MRGLSERSVPRPAGSRSTQQCDGQHSGAVKVSAVLVDVTQERMDRFVSTGPTGKDADTDCVSQLAQQAEVATGVDCRDFVVGRPTSASLSGADGCLDFAGDVAVGVTSRPFLLGLSPSVCRCWGGIPGRCWGGVPGRC